MSPHGEALQGMLPGVDNWAHFAMFLSLRRYGAVPEALGQGGDGSGWAYGSNYPKGFHAVVATLSAESALLERPTATSSAQRGNDLLDEDDAS